VAAARAARPGRLENVQKVLTRVSGDLSGDLGPILDRFWACYDFLYGSKGTPPARPAIRPWTGSDAETRGHQRDR